MTTMRRSSPHRGRRRPRQPYARPPRLADPDRRDDRDQVHGVAQTPRPHDHARAGDDRHPDCLPRRSAAAARGRARRPTGRPVATTSTPRLSAGVLYTFGFIVAATLGCTAGSVDLTDGMFRHLVITGRSRLALYLARIPAGLAIIVPLVAIGFTIVCAVCVFAAPTTLNYNGVNVPAGLSRTGLENWAADHADRSRLQLRLRTTIPVERRLRQRPGRNCRPTALDRRTVAGAGRPRADPAQIRPRPSQIAEQNYADYTKQFLYPVELPDDQDRAVARARSRHRVHRRPRPRIPPRTTHHRSDPDDRARDHPHTDRHPRHDPALREPATRRRRRRHRTPRTRSSSRWPSAAAAEDFRPLPNRPPRPSASSSPGSSAGPSSAPGG